MKYTNDDLILGEGDSKKIFDMLLKIIEYHTKINPDNRFDINKYIDVPTSIILDLLSKDFPFLSTQDAETRFCCAIDLLRVMDLTTVDGLKYKVIRHITSQDDNICFLMDPRVLRLI